VDRVLAPLPRRSPAARRLVPRPRHAADPPIPEPDNQAARAVDRRRRRPSRRSSRIPIEFPTRGEEGKVADETLAPHRHTRERSGGAEATRWNGRRGERRGGVCEGPRAARCGGRRRKWGRVPEAGAEHLDAGRAPLGWMDAAPRPGDAAACGAARSCEGFRNLGPLWRASAVVKTVVAVATLLK
jgi:hypothetical protein